MKSSTLHSALRSGIVFYFVFFLMLITDFLSAQTSNFLISKNPSPVAFTVFKENYVSSILISPQDFPAVKIAAGNLQKDILNVFGKKPELLTDLPSDSNEIIIAGTIGHNPIIEDLIAHKKIDVSQIKKKRESFIIKVINNPAKNIKKALIIVGSDRRGVVYGIYHLSEQLGVSPWYWWADVPVKKKDKAFIYANYTSHEPPVEFRGIFINDEAPALTGWVHEKFGSFNHQFYEKVFELILRLKGNYLWPAMWRPQAFSDDDPMNPKLADEMGVVIATSHHEPMMRAHDEWSRYGKGDWNYATNAGELQKFWRGGVERMNGFESVVTVGMRGDGDEAMAEDTAINLLEKIIKDQRKIIEDVTGKPAEETPQVWALYKEVQDYYDKGMRVPDDIMLLLCDDNWGNVRVLPKKENVARKGGYGIYYHFDFVGGPVSYRWLNVTQIEKVWEQMNLSYQWGAKRLWLVNVGDIKPMEFPISFFLDFAWDPENFSADKLPSYYTQWSKQQFGEEYAEEIGRIISQYTKYNGRRTPEMLKPDTYSLANYREAQSVVKNYNELLEKAKIIYDKLPEESKAAFYQLVLFPVEICANLNEMYLAAGKNHLYAEQKRASTNVYGQKVKALFENDKALTEYYHKELAEGKWNHFMSQTHIGYTSWNNPEVNIMPDVKEYEPDMEAGLGIMVEGSLAEGDGKLPEFDPINNQQYYVEIFNKGLTSLTYKATSDNKWIKLSSTNGNIRYEERLGVSIDWAKAPAGKNIGEIKISAADESFSVKVPVNNLKIQTKGFIENSGVISINAANYSQAFSTTEIKWLTVPNLGRTSSAVTISPSNADVQIPVKGTPHLEYDFTLFDEKDLDIQIYLSPTLNFKKNDGLKFAVSIDDENPQIINIHEGETQPDWKYPYWWNQSVTDHIKIKSSKHPHIKSGMHTIKIWMVDPGIVFQKIVIDAGGLRPSYLGPPESLTTTHKN